MGAGILFEICNNYIRDYAQSYIIFDLQDAIRSENRRDFSIAPMAHALLRSLSATNVGVIRIQISYRFAGEH